MSNSIIAKNSDQDREQARTCPIRQVIYKPAPGVKFETPDGRQISPEAAMQLGFAWASNFKIPEAVDSKSKLTDYLRGLGLKNSQPEYASCYAKFSQYLPLK